MPPYIIGIESKTPNPFSATNANYTGYPHPNNQFQPPAEAGPDMVPEQLSMELSMEGWSRKEGWGGPSDLATASQFESSISNLKPSFGLNDSNINQTCGFESRLSNCWQILTQGLGQFVQGKLRQGVVPTDQMLQEQARIILYGGDDGWNQTAADNPEWLELFKKAHGLHSTSTSENVDFMEDLGMAIEDMSFDALMEDSSWDALI